MNEKLRALRLEHGLTQKELATKIDTTDKNVWAYEKGLAAPPYDTLCAYAKLFNVSTDYLLGLEEEPEAARLTFEESGAPSDEQKLLSIYHSLSPEMKNTLWGLLATWSPEGATDFLKKNQK